jgi:hypothetical protein
MSVKLNLACGSDYREGWTNLDVVRQWPGCRPCDLVWDARDGVIPWPDDAVDEIYAGYLMLHIHPRFRPAMWRELERVLTPLTGVIVIGEVDMKLAMQRWLANPRDPAANDMVWGELGSVHGADLAVFDQHTHGYCEETLRAEMTKAGFSGLRRITVHHPDVWWELTLQGTKA